MNTTDRETVISIVSHAFEQNPRAMTMMKKKDPQRSVRLMTEYAYQLVEKFEGVYLSEDKTTVLFYYKKSRFKRTLVDYLLYARMFLRAIRPSQLLPTRRREKMIESMRLPYDDYIYVWVLGSAPDNRSLRGLADIRDHLFGLSKQEKLPILIETTVEKLLKLYRYVGFKDYRKWHDEEADLLVWFLERPFEEIRN